MAKRGGRSGRKYVRDNRGRFATTGATARGGRLKTASGKKRAAQTVKAKTGGKPSGAIKGKIKRDPGAAKPAAAKPAAAKPARRKGLPKDGTDITREIGRAKGNKRIKNLNQQIKEAGPNAAGLRLEKLKVQTRMPNKPRQRLQPTAKQSAKEASRNDAIRKRSAELRAQSGRLQRNQANIQRLKAQNPKPGSRRLSSSQIKRQNRADTAKSIYSAPSTKRRAQIVRNQAGIARTERAKNNSMRLRSDRLAEAKATGLPMIKVTRPAKPKRRRI
nr:hypothetical protein [uncultured Mediterranean phage uvMED]